MRKGGGRAAPPPAARRGQRGGRAESLVVEVEQRGADGDVDRGGEIERLRRPLRASPRVARGAAARGGARRRRRRRRRAGRRRGARLRGGARRAPGTTRNRRNRRARPRALGAGRQTLAAVLLGVAADVFVFARMSPRDSEHAARAGQGHGVRLGAENLRLVRRVRLRGDARRARAAATGDVGPIAAKPSARTSSPGTATGRRSGPDPRRRDHSPDAPSPRAFTLAPSPAETSPSSAATAAAARRRRRRLVPLLHGFPASPPAHASVCPRRPGASARRRWRARFNPPRPQRVPRGGRRSGRTRPSLRW